MSTLVEDYRAIAAAIEDFWGVTVHRTFPRYLREDPSSLPFAALGWLDGDDILDGSVGGLSSGNNFECGYFGKDEKDLLDAVDSLPALFDTIGVGNFTFTAIERAENDDVIELLNHAFTFQISLEE